MTDFNGDHASTIHSEHTAKNGSCFPYFRIWLHSKVYVTRMQTFMRNFSRKSYLRDDLRDHCHLYNLYTWKNAETSAERGAARIHLELMGQRGSIYHNDTLIVLKFSQLRSRFGQIALLFFKTIGVNSEEGKWNNLHQKCICEKISLL